MSSTGEELALPRRRWRTLGTSGRLLASSLRLPVYCACTLVALVVTYHLGKEMAWDTLDYHLYAGFSALHDRFGQDYFAAGPQGYFNPYVFVPFYLLVNSSLTALEVSLLLAFVQSAILWLTYELALLAAPTAPPGGRLGLALCSAAFAFANPILIGQLGTSFSDITTAEIVLLGWLLLARAIRSSRCTPVLWAALLLGCASALKLTNAGHAIAAGSMVLFVPVDWRKRVRYAVMFALATAAGFLLISAPWSIRLEEHFGNPLFPLMNPLFRSPEFTTASLVDYRFLPASLWAALWLPFALVAPRAMVDVEWAAPDLRYAVLLTAALVSLAVWLIRRKPIRQAPSAAARDPAGRVLAALACAFAIDWAIWVALSGNGRYFIPGACVASLLAIALIFRLGALRPKLRNYLLLAVFGAQLYQLHAGTEYPARLPWQDAPWFHVEVPRIESEQPTLYFSFGVQSYSFLAPYLARGSGMVNLEGSYVLAAGGMNGRHIASLVRRYSPHLRMIVRDIRSDALQDRAIPNPVNANDALEPFGLKVDDSGCTRIFVQGMPVPPIIMTDARGAEWPADKDDGGYFLSCPVVHSDPPQPALLASEHAATLALNHLEDACPALLQPARPAIYLRGDRAHGWVWARQYGNTDMLTWVRGGWVYFQRLIGGGQQGVAGKESVWERKPLPVNCGRGADGFYLRVLGTR